MKKLILIFLISINYAGESYSQSGWFWQNPLPQGNELNAVRFFFFINTGWAVGMKGTIIKVELTGLSLKLKKCYF